MSGDIEAEGRLAADTSVLGGTEAYARATGDVTITDTDEGMDFVINLT
jgi:hypothetical protein